MPREKVHFAVSCLTVTVLALRVVGELGDPQGRQTQFGLLEWLMEGKAASFQLALALR